MTAMEAQDRTAGAAPATPADATAPASPARTALTLATAAAVAFGANWIIALAAQAAGAGPFTPLQPFIFGAFTVAGVLAGSVGWRVVRRFATRPRTVLRVLVPLLALLSLAPDAVLMATGFIPGTTVTGVVALMLMHLVVAGVTVPVSQRLAPV